MRGGEGDVGEGVRGRDRVRRGVYCTVMVMRDNLFAYYGPLPLL